MAAKDDKTAAKKGGGKGWILALALTSLVAIGTGGGLGLYLLSTVEKAVDGKKKDEEDKAVKGGTLRGTDVRRRNDAESAAPSLECAELLVEEP